MFISIKLIIRSFVVLLFLSLINPLYAQQYVNEGTWAVSLVRGLGWGNKGIPSQPSLMDCFDLLSGKNLVKITIIDI